MKKKKGYTQGTAPRRATCYPYKLPDYKFSGEDEKYYMFTPQVTSKKKGFVERAKLKFKNYFPDREFDIDLP